jgi:hypothetical protein
MNLFPNSENSAGMRIEGPAGSPKIKVISIGQC